MIGLTSSTPGQIDPSIPPSQPRDLPRMPGTGFAIIGDPRNDENLIVAQMHLHFLKFHNAVASNETNSEGGRLTFEEVRKLVRWHYQWIVLHDFLKRIVDPSIVDQLLATGGTLYPTGQEPYIPVEFAVAAYRLGHSMVRQVYNHNRVFNETSNPPGSLELLFLFSGRSSNGQAVPIPSDWIIDWTRFFEINGSKPGLSRKLNPLLAATLQAIPPANFSLAVANLRRGERRGLPSGQAIACALGLKALGPDDFGNPDPHPDHVILKHKLGDRTPLWYYILKEAELEGGTRLGPVGGRIVAEVFVGLLAKDPESFLAQCPGWTPTLGNAGSDFSMASLLEYVGELRP